MILGILVLHFDTNNRRELIVEIKNASLQRAISVSCCFLIFYFKRVQQMLAYAFGFGVVRGFACIQSPHRFHFIIGKREIKDIQI